MPMTLGSRPASNRVHCRSAFVSPVGRGAPGLKQFELIHLPTVKMTDEKLHLLFQPLDTFTVCELPGIQFAMQLPALFFQRL